MQPAAASSSTMFPIDRRPALRRLLMATALTAIVAAGLALVVVQRLADSYRIGLDAAAEGADVTSKVAQSAAAVTADVATLADTTAEVFVRGERTLDVSAEGLQQVAEAARSNLAEGVEGTATVASRAASLIEGIERFIPGDRDSLAEDLRAVADGLEPAPQQLRDLATQLDSTASSLTTTADQIGDLVGPSAALAANVAESRASLDEVAVLASDVATTARDQRDRSAVDLWLLRLLIIAVGAGVCIAALGARRLLPVEHSTSRAI
jgi:uncharacterized phage infection (PIP) family protein YhgE